MKIERSEFGHEYQTYRFGYREHAIIEPGDRVADFYDKGFLPYSANPAIQGRFYMARSARIDLQKFELTSENRRIDKRFDNIFSVRELSLEEARADARMRALFLTYFEARHGKEVMPPERFDAILSSPLPLRVVSYEKDGVLIAAVLEVADESFGHFWFSAYDLSYTNQSLGMWLMLNAARGAQKAGRTHYYLGTVYGAKALYKTNLEPLEFWDGSTWSTDLAQLKTLAREESRTT